MLTVDIDRRTRTFKLPAVSSRLLSRGSRFIFSQSGDTILLKQIQEPIWRIADRNPDKAKPSVAEINRLVRKARRKTAKNR